MGRSSRDRTIRILILGEAGVGKNCLESRFTTTTYPPPYDPALTVSSRRYFTLSTSGHAVPPPAALTRPLNTSHGLSNLGSVPIITHPRPRSPSGLSTFSNPASERVVSHDNHNPETQRQHHDNSLPHDPRSQLATTAATVSTRPVPDEAPYSPCADCLRECDTYLVELINYPALQLPRARAQVLSKGEYDAVVLVYDVGRRGTFESIVDLHAEIPIRQHHSHHHRRRRTGEEGRGGAGGSGYGASWVGRRSIFGGLGGGSGGEWSRGAGETVVALVGNKSDFDTESVSAEPGGCHLEEEKAAVIQEADVEERSLVHPLYRESRFYDELSLGPISPGARSDQGYRAAAESELARRSVLSADNALDARRDRHGRARRRPLGDSQLPRADKVGAIERWLQTGSPSAEDGAPSTAHKEEDCTHVGSNGTGSTAGPGAAKRQVSRAEGEMLVRKLLLHVPYFETSAKTGENVEELFEAVVRAVLQETGRGVEPRGTQAAPAEPRRCCTRREREAGRDEDAGAVPARGREHEGLCAEESRINTSTATSEEAKAEAAVIKEAAAEDASRPRAVPVAAAHQLRHEGVIGRMRRILGKTGVMVENGVAA